MALRPFVVELVDDDNDERYANVLIGHSPGDVSSDMEFIIDQSWFSARVIAVRELDRTDFARFVAGATAVPEEPRAAVERILDNPVLLGIAAAGAKVAGSVDRAIAAMSKCSRGTVHKVMTDRGLCVRGGKVVPRDKAA